MSKTTLALIAALSASSGAALTAAWLSRFPGATVPGASLTTTASSATTNYAAPLAVVPAINASVYSKSPVDPAAFFEYGFPGPVADVAPRRAYVSSFDRRTRNPHWAIEHITPQSLSQSNADRRHSQFVEDESLPEKFRALLRDYSRSGYDRGHQVPAADAKWSQDAMDDTFFLTNMCPQVGQGFNRDYWAHFEDFCRRLTQRYPSVRVVTGPLYLPKKDPADDKWYVKYEVIGSPPNVAVPTHFYKVIFAEDDATATAKGSSAKVAVGAFVLPNARIPNDKPLTDFEVPLEIVERASGLEFARKLDPARRKSLCSDTNCSLVVKNYADRQKVANGGKS